MFERFTARQTDWSRVEGALGKENLETLKNKKVTVIGVGGLGANVTRLLAMNGVEKFVLVDPDSVKAHNITRYPAVIRDINKPKIEVIRDLILSKNPQALVTTIKEDARFVQIQKTDLTIIAGLGSQDAQEQVANSALKDGNTVLVAGVYNTGDAGEFFVLRPDRGPCYSCFRELTREKVNRIVPRQETPYGVPVDQVEAVPGLANHIEMVAALAVDTALNVLLDKPISHHNNPNINMYIFAIKRIKLHIPVPEDQQSLGPLSARFFSLPKAVDCKNCYPPKNSQPRRRLNQILRD